MNNLKKKATLSILLMVSMGHLLNDMFQSVIPSIYPIIKESLGLSFMQIGAITLTNQITASLLPGNVGMISGAFFGLSFGLGGIGSALFGWIADLTNIQYVFQLTAFLPLLGIAAYFLPNIKE